MPGLEDYLPALLELAAQQDRILVTYDRQTMTRFFREHLERGGQVPGVFILRQDESLIGPIIEWLLFVWADSESEEWRNQIIFVSL